MRRFKNVDRSTLDVDQLHGFIVSQTIKLSEKLGRKKRKTTEKPLGFINPQDWSVIFTLCYESDGPSTDTVPVLIKDGYFP